MSKSSYAKYEFVDPTDPDFDQICPVCNLLVNDAYQVFCKCETRIMCRSCVDQLISHDKPCPQCNRVISGRRKDHDSDREIQSLMVFCNFKSSGCDWTGELIQADWHIQNCKDLKQKSPFKEIGCNSTVTRKDYAAHVQEQLTFHLNLLVMQQMHKPAVLKFTGVNLHENDAMFSSPFYTGVGGYKMRLVIIIPNHETVISNNQEAIASGDDEATTSDNGESDVESDDDKTNNPKTATSDNDEASSSDDGESHSDVESTKVYLFAGLNLMPGENDDTLEFPVRGVFTITLLNQIENDNHYHRYFCLDEDTDQMFQKKIETDNSYAGITKFILHTDLHFTEDETRFFENGTLFFRVSFELVSEIKPWLAIK